MLPLPRQLDAPSWVQEPSGWQQAPLQVTLAQSEPSPLYTPPPEVHCVPVGPDTQTPVAKQQAPGPTSALIRARKPAKGLPLKKKLQAELAALFGSKLPNWSAVVPVSAAPMMRQVNCCGLLAGLDTLMWIVFCVSTTGVAR